MRLFWAVATFWRLRSVPLPPRYSCGRHFCKTGGGYRSSNGWRGPVYNVDSTTLGVGSQVESGAQQQCWRLCLDKQIALPYPLTNPPPSKPPREAVDLQLCFLQTNPYITNPKVFLSLIEFLNALIHASYSLINNLPESTLLSDNSSFKTNLCDCLLDNPFCSIQEFLDCKIDVEM